MITPAHPLDQPATIRATDEQGAGLALCSAWIGQTAGHLGAQLLAGNTERDHSPHFQSLQP